MVKRIAPADLPETLPLFPLSGALLLPRARLPLNIFEPRYLTMLDDALKTPERLIGMIQPMEETPDTGTQRLHRIGCAGRIVGFAETEDGRYQISLAGISRFRLIAQVDGFTPYIRAGISWDGFEADLTPPPDGADFDRENFLAILARYFDAVNLSSDWDSLREADGELLINSLSMLCPFAPEEKQALLETASLAERRETLIALMQFALASGGQEEGPLN